MNAYAIILLVILSMLLVAELVLNWSRFSGNAAASFLILNSSFGIMVVAVVLITQLHSLNLFLLAIPIALYNTTRQGLNYRNSDTLLFRNFNVFFLNCSCIILLLALLVRIGTSH